MPSISVVYQVARDDQVPLCLRPAFFISDDEHWLRIEVIALKVIHGLPNTEVLLKEKEVFSVAEGDFVDQHPNPIGHSPADDYVKYSAAYDRIFCCINKTKRHTIGSIKWHIPLVIFNPETLEKIKITVTQEYRLQDRKITILKGESILVENYPIS